MNFMMLAAEAAPELNVLDLAMKGGWIMVVLALLSVFGIYIFVERFAVLRKAMKRNPYLLDRLHDNIKDGDFKSAINYCTSQNTPISRTYIKGIKDYNLDNVAIRQALDNTASLEIANLEKGFPILSTIAAVAPMLGFLGTVTGMVQAFWQMSNAGNNIDITLLSGGIYEAMVTTVAGLIVGIVAIFAYNFLVTRIDRLQNIMEADIISFMEIVNEVKAEKSAVAAAPVKMENPTIPVVEPATTVVAGNNVMRSTDYVN